MSFSSILRASSCVALKSMRTVSACQYLKSSTSSPYTNTWVQCLSKMSWHSIVVYSSRSSLTSNRYFFEASKSLTTYILFRLHLYFFPCTCLRRADVLKNYRIKITILLSFHGSSASASGWNANHQPFWRGPLVFHVTGSIRHSNGPHETFRPWGFCPTIAGAWIGSLSSGGLLGAGGGPRTLVAPTASQGASNPGSGTRRARSRSSVQCQTPLFGTRFDLAWPRTFAGPFPPPTSTPNARPARQRSRCPTTPRMGVCILTSQTRPRRRQRQEISAPRSPRPS